MDGTVGQYLSSGIRECLGDIVVFLDDDDSFSADKLEYVFNFFRKKNGLVYLHNNAKYVDYEGKTLKKIHRNNIDFNMSCISIKKTIVNFKELENIYTAPDTLMYLFALQSSGKIINSNYKLTYYRVHQGNTSNNLEWYKIYRKQLKSFYFKYHDRKERDVLEDHILSSAIFIHIKEGKELKFKRFIYDLLFLSITLNKTLLVLLIKRELMSIYKKYMSK